ncbi:protein ALTERED PHOSPHATE STARVATION RESPONSE 1-like [Salvia miltiorrhiza]|uniref:protein ALTERED PHOSPHATE STARVATION RESPONSE 1-like n=1 Tax=Salvia miltiorrhiza TaxID=226208 RepID=UPI0025AD16DE|nr:protein ALTERED PHOSPHATE STARVATION RESPONSE 1-like [Salvia miltiorrhiza]XP_057786065.1 protein ALTERED PHOSPHATE STARVATION RESPONSE 1-like [Salvia miltiorrhiza]XP_057786066.1 protein ALTERED PHOSPHATE STARVATION RESPONSE 1-like [Salvia miltiorrhiza]XP_057786067.1 protein ALTERED PHOSPHATE STARVATION RESPONSE 1-like [Salvia miltiorrhiza]
MGITNSKGERSSALKLCRERKKFIKQAIDSRYALAAAHVSYVQSLRNLGIALRRFAEAEVLVETSLSASATELDKTPSHSSYPSPSPSHLGGVSDSPVLNGSPLSTARVSYMRSSGATALTVRLNTRNSFVEEGEFSMPPPPPPPPDDSGWDYFDPADESFRFPGQDGNLDTDDAGMYGDSGKKEFDFSRGNGIYEREGSMTPKLESPTNGNGRLAAENSQQRVEGEVKDMAVGKEVSGSRGKVAGKTPVGQSNSRTNKSVVENDICAEREDPSEFITHRAKDFLSSIKDIDSRFFRASESGREVSRMLEANKIHVGYAEARGASSASLYLTSFGVGCCQGGSANISDDQIVTKVITWKRTTSSKSSSSRNPLAMKDDDDSGSEYIDEFCMISGSHSSTLDRLYAWERKLYDEVKASESIQREYDRKCDQLRHQFAKDLSPQVIDKTRAAVKDLHSRIRVALHAVDSISKRIEKMRDEELLPQLRELIQGLTTMWKAMLECHHSQYITISLAYHTKSSAVAPLGETQRQIINQLQDEVEYFGLSFADWINSYTSYVEALNSWLQNCILQPRERKGRRGEAPPRRSLAPSIFVLCRDWSAGIKSLPSQEVSDAIKAFLGDLRRSVRNQSEEPRKTGNTGESQNDEADGKAEEDKDGDRPSHISCVQPSLTKVLDRLTKFSEASVKMCEDIWQKCDTARNAYENYKAPPRSYSI